MNYTFNQVKALFSEHDHFAIAIPESRKGRNILELNKLYVQLLQDGHSEETTLNDVPDLF